MKRTIVCLTFAFFFLLSCSKDSTAPNVLNPSNTTGTMMDIDSNFYRTVLIGSHWWMAENLKVTHYNDGQVIPEVTDDSQWEGLNTAAYCNYENDENITPKRGLLYNGYTNNNFKNIAPVGWHVPTDEEWQNLVNCCGGDSLAGDKMKSAGATLWTGGACTNSSNESGLTVLAGGFRDRHGIFRGKYSTALFWSSTEINDDSACSRLFRFDCSGAYPNRGPKRYGFSIRCIQD